MGNTLRFSFVLLASLVSLSFSVRSQTWKYRQPIKVVSHFSRDTANYQVMITVDTQNPISQGKMHSRGDDIRFGNCNIVDKYAYYIEKAGDNSGNEVINSMQTNIWLLIDTLKANDTLDIVMYYGNKVAPAFSNFDVVFPPSTRFSYDHSIHFNGISGSFNYSWMHLKVTDTLQLSQSNTATKFNARKVIIDGTILGDAAGFLGSSADTVPGEGPGGGTSGGKTTGATPAPGGGGGGHAGRGGNGGNDTLNFGIGGAPNNSVIDSSANVGSGGGAGGGNISKGGNGGGSVIFRASSYYQKGHISMNGGRGDISITFNNSAGGGGAGGAIVIVAERLYTSLSSSLFVQGGEGGLADFFNNPNYGGGGGAGGYVKFFYEKSTVQSQIFIEGALGNPVGGEKGDDGIIQDLKVNTEEPDVLINDVLSIVNTIPKSNAVCTGSPLRVFATPGFSKYRLLRNGVSIAGPQSDSVFTVSTGSGGQVNDGDKLQVVAYLAEGAKCMDTSKVVNIKLVASASFTFQPTSPQQICSGSSFVVNISPSLDATYSWSNAVNSTRVLNAQGYTATITPSAATLYTITATNSIGCTRSAQYSITTLSSPFLAASPDSQTVCTGAPTTLSASGATSYKWIPSATLDKDTGIVVQARPLANTTYVVIGTDANGCSATKSLRLYVLPTPTIAVSEKVSVICSGNKDTLIVTGNADRYSWSPPFYLNTVDNDSVIVTPLADGTYKYYVTGIDTTSPPCPSTTDSVLVQVIPGISTGTINITPSYICEGGRVNVTLSSYTGKIQWQSRDTTATSTWADIEPFAANLTKDDVTFEIMTGTFFRAVISSNGCTSDTTDSVKVSLLPIISKPLVSSSDVQLCGDSIIELTGANSPSGTETGSWEAIFPSTLSKSLTGPTSARFLNIPYGDSTRVAWVFKDNTTGCSDSAFVRLDRIHASSPAIAGPDQKSCTDTAILTAITPVYGVGHWERLSGSAVILQANNSTTKVVGLQFGSNLFRWVVENESCPPLEDLVLIDKVASIAGGRVTATTDTICEGESLTLTLIENSGGTLIQWQDSLPNGNWADISGASNTTYKAEPSSTRYYRTRAYTASCLPIASQPLYLGVIPSPVPGDPGPNQEICIGDSATLHLRNYSGSIQWQTVSDTTLSSITNIPGATDTILKIRPVVVGDGFYRGRVGLQSCIFRYSRWTKISVFDITTSAKTTATPTLICEGSTITANATSSNGTYFQWEKSTDSTLFRIIPGANGTLVNDNPRETSFYRVIVKNGGCPIKISDTSKVNVSSTTRPGTASVSSSKICTGATVRLLLSNYNGTIQWQRSSNGVGAWTNIPNATKTNYPVSVEQESYFRAIVKNSPCADSISNVVKVSTLPFVVRAGKINGGPYHCNGTLTTLKLTGYNGSLQWQESPDSVNFTDIFAATNDEVQVNPAANTFYRMLATSNSICFDTSAIVKLTIVPPATAGFVTGNANICRGQEDTLRLNSFLGTIQWQESTNNIYFKNIPAETDTVLLVSPTLTRYYRSLTTLGACQDSSDSFTVNVSVPAIAGTAFVDNATHCSGEVNYLRLTGNVGAIQWQSSANGSNPWTDIPNFTHTLELIDPGVKTFYRAMVGNPVCGVAYTNVLTVNAFLSSIGGTITAPRDTICRGEQSLAYASGYRGSLVWQYSLDGFTAWTDIPAQNSPTYTENNTQLGKYLRVKATNASCAPHYSNSVLVDVVPASKAGTITALADTICDGNMTSMNLTNYAGNIQWQSSANGTSGWTDITDAYQPYYTTAILSTTTYYRVVSSNASCTYVSSVQKITVIKRNFGGTVSPSDKKICAGDSVDIGIGQSSGAIQWQSSTDNISYVDIPGASSAGIIVKPNVRTYYRVKTTAKGCEDGFSTVGKIEVTPLPEPGVVSPAEQILENKHSLARIFINDQKGKIQWQRSEDGSNFTDISGETSTLLIANVDSVAYFRARVSNDTCESISNRVVARLGYVELVIFPVPVVDELRAEFSLDSDQELNYLIHDSKGSLVKLGTFSGKKGSNEFVIDLHELSMGMYHLKITNGTVTREAKFVKDN